MKNYTISTLTLLGALLLAVIPMSNLFAYQMIPPYETTRLKSTAGAGWGSILMDEASVLNPASLAFYNNSAIYYQSNDCDHSDLEDPNNFIDGDTWAIIASDTSSSMKGSFSYIKQTFAKQTRRTMGFAIAAPMEKNSVVGVGVKYNRDLYRKYDGTRSGDDYYQATFSVMHAIDSAFTIGAGIVDAFNQKKEDRGFYLGMQYNFKDFVAALVDVGSDYKADIVENISIKGALQFKLLADFYFRFGASRDNRHLTSASAFGLGWISPKLAFEFAIKRTKQESELATLYKTNNITDTSFSLSYRF